MFIASAVLERLLPIPMSVSALRRNRFTAQYEHGTLNVNIVLAGSKPRREASAEYHSLDGSVGFESGVARSESVHQRFWDRPELGVIRD